MPRLHKLRVFCALPAGDKKLVLEAAALLALARFAVAAVPFRFLAPLLRRGPEVCTGDAVLCARVGWAVTAAARAVPWDAVCLPQAMAAKVMLARRGQGSSLHLGAGFDAQGGMIAHAWLESDGATVVGRAGAAAVTRIACFGGAPGKYPATGMEPPL